MPKWFSEQEREWIYKRLLEHGYRIFAAYGLKRARVEEIAQAAGISKGAFYRFYDSKEALFMDVVEQAEVRIRGNILAMVDQPGPTPRARLYAVLKQAFALFHEDSVLRSFNSSDYELVFRRIPPERLQQHLESDQDFFIAMTVRCRKAGIPIQKEFAEISTLLYPLVLAALHQYNLGPTSMFGSIDLLLELVAAYCLGEVELQMEHAAAQQEGIKQ